MDGNLSRWEVRRLTNLQRADWMNMLTERAKAQEEARDQAQAKSGGRKK